MLHGKKRKKRREQRGEEGPEKLCIPSHFPALLLG